MFGSFMRTNIGKSLLRPRDRVELFLSCLACFSLITLSSWAQHLPIASELLRSYIDIFIKHQLIISLVFSGLIAHVQYQLYIKTKHEVFCRLLVGDYPLSIGVRYVLECLIIQSLAVFVALIPSACGVQLSIDTWYLYGLILVYALIPATMVSTHEIL